MPQICQSGSKADSQLRLADILRREVKGQVSVGSKEISGS